MTYVVGEEYEYPVFWDTGDGRPDGYHRARILEIRPMRKPYMGLTTILKLYAPKTKKGWVEMTVE
jgi:hypothetical protein